MRCTCSCIMVIAPMRLEKLRQVDLNLLIIFAVIAEERSATKASARLLLSQPAVSRALQRARSMFQDELVIRSSSGFELTLRGRKILQELEQLLPKIEGLVVPSVFDPKKERSNFRTRGSLPTRGTHGFARRCARFLLRKHLSIVYDPCGWRSELNRIFAAYMGGRRTGN